MRGPLAAALTLWLFLTPGPAVRAQTVSADKQGNIWFTGAAGRRVRLTTDGKNSDPALSPDKRRIAYVHETAGKAISTGSGAAAPPQQRGMDIDRQPPATHVRPADARKVEDILAGFSSPAWSPDGRTLYFAGAAYATSGAIHAYDFGTKRVRFFLPGNDPQVVPTGEYKGDLLVMQHRYVLGGGSYDWYWLFTPAGKEVGPVGETTDGFRAMYFEAR